MNALASCGSTRRRAAARSKPAIGIWATYLVGGLACALLRTPFGFGAMALSLLVVAAALHTGIDLDRTRVRRSFVMRSPNAARGLNVAVGIWLFISAFVWQHTQAQLTNTWILGLITVIVALVAMYARPQVRFVNTLAAVYLFISTLALPSTSGGTIWNNILCSIAIFILSLVPGENERSMAGGVGHVIRRPA